MSPADLWEHKRREGMTQQQATEYVNAALQTRQQQPRPDPGPSVRPGAPPARTESTGEYIAGLTRSAAKGLTLGWGDEIEALARSAFTPDRTYGQVAQEVRGRMAEFEEAHPVASTTAEVAGGIGGVLAGGAALRGLGMAGRAAQGVGAAGRAARGAEAMGGAARGARLIHRVGAAAKEGAIVGGIAGAGTAEGGVRGSVGGAAQGATVGAAVGPMAMGVGGVARRAVGAVKPVASAVVDAVGRPGATPGPAARLIRRVTPLQTTQERADGLVLRALERDRVPLPELAQRASAGEHRGQMLMDLAGENTRGLARAAQSTPGEGKEVLSRVLNERAEAQPTRIAQELERGMGTERKDVFQTIEERLARRREAAAPLYDAAYKAPPVDDPEVLKVFSLPAFQRAHDVGRRIAAAEGVKIPNLYEMVNVGGEQMRVMIPQPVQALDYVKRGLDDVLERRMRSGKMGRTEARALRERLNGMLGRLDEIVPEYKAARQQYAGDSAALEALETGRNFLKADARLTARQVRQMSEAEKETFRLGAIDAIRQRMDQAADGRDLTRTIFGNTEIRAKLAAAFPDVQTFEAFQRAMEEEARMASTRNAVLAGSRTAPLLAEMADATVPAGVVVDAATGNVGGMVGKLATSGVARRLKGQTEANLDAATQRLIAGAGGKDELVRVIQELEQEVARRDQSRGRRRLIGRATRYTIEGKSGREAGAP